MQKPTKAGLSAVSLSLAGAWYLKTKTKNKRWEINKSLSLFIIKNNHVHAQKVMQNNSEMLKGISNENFTVYPDIKIDLKCI